jgi:hypothetical protein
VKGCFDSDLQKKETKKKTQLMLNWKKALTFHTTLNIIMTFHGKSHCTLCCNTERSNVKFVRYEWQITGRKWQIL